MHHRKIAVRRADDDNLVEVVAVLVRHQAVGEVRCRAKVDDLLAAGAESGGERAVTVQTGHDKIVAPWKPLIKDALMKCVAGHKDFFALHRHGTSKFLSVARTRVARSSTLRVGKIAAQIKINIGNFDLAI